MLRRLMVGQSALNRLIVVRIHTKQQIRQERVFRCGASRDAHRGQRQESVILIFWRKIKSRNAKIL